MPLVADFGYCEVCEMSLRQQQDLETQIVASKIKVCNRHSVCEHILIYKSVLPPLASLVTRYMEMHPFGKRNARSRS